jgi:antitoxin CptB
VPRHDADQILDERALSRLRWRCRRGLLENDLFISASSPPRGAASRCARRAACST